MMNMIPGANNETTTGMSHHFDPLEARDPQEREESLMANLPALIACAKTAPGWAEILKDIDPRDVRSRAALARLPITHKSDLRDMQARLPPFGGLATTEPQRLRRLYMSPGPIHEPEGRGTDWWRAARPLHALGLREGDLLQNCFSYHFTPAAFMIEGGAARLDCPVIPAGIGQTELQVNAMQALRPTAYAGTPSFLKLILEKAHAMGADVSSLDKALVSAEALPASLRDWLRSNGVPHVLQFYGSADIGNIAYETRTDLTVHPGMVIDEDVLAEIVNVASGEPVAPGEVGEVVVTSFNEDYPMIRLATGDLSAVLPGIAPCGRTNTRIRGWMGRADQAAKVRGMFVHPAQIADILKRCPYVLRARMTVSGRVGEDRMVLVCETATPQADQTHAADVIAAIRDVTKLRGEVEFVSRGSLPNDGKSIDDVRQYD